MSISLNKAFVAGRLTRDPEGRTTPNGQRVTSFSVATNRVFKDKEGNKQEQVEFHNIVLWGRLAEIASQYLVKGQEVLVEGRIQTRSWDGQDGSKKYRTEIVGESMQLGSKPGGAGGSSGFVPKEEEREASGEPTEKKEPKKAATNEDVEEIKIEDIPF
jgi:single-strand DNA-binding protein